ncbi:MAG: S-methyl-5-thioribose-1-phosphate isomerase [Magnetococcales bacterium]|nr:S-methyl-5-thioribose-1-phosphate isomerase [Magnetococcales bacterium]
MASPTYQAVSWNDGAVRLLEQRDLPHREHYKDYQGARETADAIRDMVVRGAPAIGCTAAYGLASEAFTIMKSRGIPNSWSDALAPGMETLRNSRPTAVNLMWALDELKPLVEERSADPATLPERLLAAAQKIFDDDVASCKAMGRIGAQLLPDTGDRPITIMTHCNAGALATAGYGTALGVIRGAVEMGRSVHVIANETRPYLQGARLTAWELLEDGIDTTLITDNMAGWLMQCGEIDAIVVGADRVAGNGDAANKIGTYTHSVLAKRHGIPFFVACPLSTIDRETASGSGIAIEDRDAKEVTEIFDKPIAPANVKVRHPAFDVTPAELITALVTEKGAVHPPSKEGIDTLFE